MGAAYSNEQAQHMVLAAANKINATVLPFRYTKANETTVPLSCNICSHTWPSLFGNLVNQGKGCRSCAGTLPIPQEIAEERVALAVKISGSVAKPFMYTTSKKTIINLECATCKKKRTGSYDAIVSGKSSCSRCSGVERLSPTVATQILELKLSVKHISFSKFDWTTANKTRVSCKCNVCEYTWDASHSNLIYNKGTGCASCSGNLKIPYKERCKIYIRALKQKI